ncbi:DNA repair protein RecO [Veillonella sp.]|uniref:DNA repair protein RecO n=1 Tax=Veillonella sp. TaxID=1926307 RepID=UPI002907E91B|nr:DNA repair protein RecO C-terminal domain-containing protein [Veillonella sp.]MDU3476455.1 DNA repair protein RecO C-terminal domain-containing protein [Veillonella sp.]MDU3481749.1 DNA repair protein RecO C-terminal domain-containing protein [Veillonella sp.]
MKKLNGGFNTPAIVISRKKYKLYSVFTFITPSLGLIKASIPHKRMMTMRNSSYLRPFSAMHITVVPDGEYVNVTQIDGSYVVESLDVNLDNIAYAAVASELIQELFAMYDVDRKVFDTVVNYSKQIRRRNVQLGTIMLGWQLLSLAGVVPSANAFNHQDGIEPFWMQVRETTNLSISRSVKATLPQILAYQWGEDTPLEFPKTIWKELEKLLFAYCEQEIGKPLQSVKFLNSII